MFSPRCVRMVLMPAGLSATAAAIASSTSSPGMNFFTERRTNPVRIAVPRIHAFVEAHRNSFRVNGMIVILSHGLHGLHGLFESVQSAAQSPGYVHINVTESLQSVKPAFNKARAWNR